MGESGVLKGNAAALSLSPDGKVLGQYPNLLYLLESRLREAHDVSLREPKNQAVRERIDALTTCAPGSDWPELLELLELLSTEVRRLKVTQQRDRADQERNFMRWRSRLVAEKLAKEESNGSK